LLVFEVAAFQKISLQKFFMQYLALHLNYMSGSSYPPQFHYYSTTYVTYVSHRVSFYVMS
jgi:hypothetical protein